MHLRSTLAASGLALSAFLLAVPAMSQSHINADGMPTNDSTPAEKAETARINKEVSDANAQADAMAAAATVQSDTANAQYQAQQQQYQEQLQQNQAAQADFEAQNARYQALRGRYAAERAAYRRGVWPERWTRWTLDTWDSRLINQRVEILNGDRVGTVIDVARTGSGRVDALLVRLDNGKEVWIDRADIRYDRADGIVMTNLDRTDLHKMADYRL